MQASSSCAQNARESPVLEQPLCPLQKQTGVGLVKTPGEDNHPIQSGTSKPISLSHPISKARRRGESGLVRASNCSPPSRNTIRALPCNNDGNNNSRDSIRNSITSIQGPELFELSVVSEPSVKSLGKAGPTSSARNSVVNAAQRKRVAEEPICPSTPKKNHAQTPNAGLDINAVGPNILNQTETANIAWGDSEPQGPNRGTTVSAPFCKSGIGSLLPRPSAGQSEAGGRFKEQANPFSAVRQPYQNFTGKRINRKKGKGPHITMNASARLVKHQLLRPCRCKRLCFVRFVREAREEIHRAFWDRDFKGRRAFFEKHIKVLHCRPSHKAKRIPENKYKRKFSLEYSLPIEEPNSERVCKAMFLATLGLKHDAMVTCYLRKKMQKGTECALKDERGRADSLALMMTRNIRQHIESFHPQVSHYRRKHAPLRRYLEPSLSVWTMWKEFLHSIGRVSYSKYWKVFRAQRITFGSPNADLCEIYEENKEHRRDRGVHSLADCEQCSIHAIHQSNAAISRKQYSDDRNREWPTGFGVFAVDMQRVLLVPIMKGKRAFFTSRLVCFNATFASISGQRDICVVWNEATAGRNADDVASAYAFFIEHHPEYKHFLF